MSGDARRGQTPKKRGRPWVKPFLESLRLTGNVSEACRAADLGCRDTAYKLYRGDPEFARLWDEAVDEAMDRLEEEARRRAVDGTRRPVFYKGVQVGAVREYSDLLLIFLLKGGRPEKYRERAAVEHTGRKGGPLQVRHEHTIDPSAFAAAFESFARAVLGEGVAAVREDGTTESLDSPPAAPEAGPLPPP